jgi:hypothetical protein
MSESTMTKETIHTATDEELRPEFENMMCQAASKRRLVELVDGRVGRLVYYPGKNAAERKRKKPLRHGDPLMAGVQLDLDNTSRVTAFHVWDIVGFADVEEGQVA